MVPGHSEMSARISTKSCDLELNCLRLGCDSDDLQDSKNYFSVKKSSYLKILRGNIGNIFLDTNVHFVNYSCVFTLLFEEVFLVYVLLKILRRL